MDTEAYHMAVLFVMDAKVRVIYWLRLRTMDNQGWITLHRKLLDNPISKKPLIAWFFIFCLLRANHKEKKILWNGKEIVIARGSFVSGLRTLSRESGLSLQSVRTGCVTLKSTHMLTIKTTSKWSLITILNYEKYQEVTHLLTNKQHTTNTHTNNKQQENNDNNEKKEESTHVYKKLEYLTNIPLEDVSLLIKGTGADEEKLRSKGEDLYNWVKSKGKPQKDYKAFLRNAIKKDFPSLTTSQTSRYKLIPRSI